MTDWLTWQVIDSAFPIGAFAHSWGLEASWQFDHLQEPGDLESFLSATTQQTAHSALPLLAATFREPDRLSELDNLADAFLLNHIANRASRVQGRSLVSTASRIWPSEKMESVAAQADVSRAHLAPLSGVVFRLIGLSFETSRKVMLYGTVRGVLSAAVRLGLTGSYQAQRLQHEVGPWLDRLLDETRLLEPEDLCQTAPIIDLLQSKHDRLYSRLFQS